MRSFSKILLAAGAVVAFGTAAWAASDTVHHTQVRLADGSVANITYTGDVAPKVELAAPNPFDDAAFGPQIAFAPFPDFARIQAQMNMQMQQMMRQANAMMAMPMATANAPIQTAFGAMAPGAHFCAQSVSIITDGSGRQNVVRHSSGDCGGVAQNGKPAVEDHAPAAPHHGTPI